MRPKLPNPLETEIWKSIRDRLSVHGITLWRRNVGALKWKHKDKSGWVMFSRPGQSDLWGIGPDGRHWEIEAKRYGKKPTKAQMAWLLYCSRIGAVAFWADSPDVAERVALAVLEGGQIEWLEGVDYDVRFPE